MSVDLQEQKCYSISCIRLFSIMLIVAAHILAYACKLDEIAHWFTFGVEMFLFMSGWLYAKKQIKNSYGYIVKNFKKILFPYYVTLAILFALYIIFTHKPISITTQLALLFAQRTPESTQLGLGHFWFIKHILLCYLITPLLYSLSETKKQYGVRRFKKAGITFCTILFFIGLFYKEFVIKYIIVYVIGYWTSKAVDAYSLSMKKVASKSLLFSAPLLFAKIIARYAGSAFTDNIFYLFCKIAEPYFFVAFAVTVFLFMMLLFDQIPYKKCAFLCKALDLSDQYVYLIYLCHQPLMLGPLSIFDRGTSLLFIILSVFASVIFAIIIKLCCDLIKRVRRKDIKNVQTIS